MKLSAACIWKKGRYLRKKEAPSCFRSSDGRGRGTAALVAPGRAVPTLRIADSRDIPLHTGITALLQPSPRFLVNVHTVAPRRGNEMESRARKSQAFKKSPC